MNPAIHLKDVSFSYGNKTRALNQVSLEVPEHEFLGVIGPNGGGKSTLLKLILGLAVPSSGSVSVLGQSPKRARRKIGYVPQFAQFDRNFPITVYDTILMGRLDRSLLFRRYQKEDRDITKGLLEKLRIQSIADRAIGEISGGQLQRVLIARALACDPKILLLDEPTSNIDPSGELDLFSILKELNKEMTILFVSHDVGFISKYIHRVACINQSLVCHDTGQLSDESMRALYGSAVHSVEHHHAHPEDDEE